jgi:hypothetical protein
MITCDTPLYLDGDLYLGARKIGFTEDGKFLVDLFTTPPPNPRGSMVTVFAISSRNYREKYRTKARACRTNDGIAVFDDIGRMHLITGDNDLYTRLEEECKRENFWEETPQTIN